MLLKHSTLYLLARGVPGIVNFLAIAVYTRLLGPEEYGRYALVVEGVGLLNVVAFQWLRLALLRFFPAHASNPKPLLSTVLGGFAGLAALTGTLGLVAVGLSPDESWRRSFLVAVPLLWAQAWFELNLELVRSKLDPMHYGAMSAVKAASALLLGGLMASSGLGGMGPLLGLLVGFLIASALNWRDWGGAVPRLDRNLLKSLLDYGLPLTATFALAFVVSGSDRFFIAWFLGDGPVGVYAASYDIAKQSLTLLMTVINLAAYPLAVRALETKGIEAARRQLTTNAEVLLGVALPCAAALALLSPQVAALVLGTEFQPEAPLLISLVTVAALLAGVRSYHFDLAFQLGRRTVEQVWVMGAAAVLNLLLNLWWIPQLGLLGAGLATVVAYAVALLISAYLGRRVFPVSIDWRSTGKLVLSTAAITPILLVGRVARGWLDLVLVMAAAGFVYGGFLLLLDVGGLRPKLIGLMGKLRHES